MRILLALTLNRPSAPILAHTTLISDVTPLISTHPTLFGSKRGCKLLYSFYTNISSNYCHRVYSFTSDDTDGDAPRRLDFSSAKKYSWMTAIDDAINKYSSSQVLETLRRYVSSLRPIGTPSIPLYSPGGFSLTYRTLLAADPRTKKHWAMSRLHGAMFPACVCYLQTALLRQLFHTTQEVRYFLLCGSQ